MILQQSPRRQRLVLRLVSTLLLGWLALVAMPLKAATFSALYIFGDSLSDTGNRISVTFPYFLPPPFYRNRFSNGPVAVDVLGAHLGLPVNASLHLVQITSAGTNYSVDGAEAGGSGEYDLPAQIDAFLANAAGIADPNALYLMFIGGNDIRSSRNTSDPVQANLILQQASTGIGNALEQLIAAGGRQLLVVNGPDIGKIPETRIKAEEMNDPGYITQATQKSQTFNTLLAQRVQDIETAHHLGIRQYDLAGFMTAVLHNATALGFTNTTEGCFDSSHLQYYPDCDNGNNFDTFVFFDDIHPTAKTHALLGDALYEASQASPAAPPPPGPTSVNAAITPILMLLLND